jgi:hypothetical protein
MAMSHETSFNATASTHPLLRFGAFLLPAPTRLSPTLETEYQEKQAQSLESEDAGLAPTVAVNGRYYVHEGYLHCMPASRRQSWPSN